MDYNLNLNEIDNNLHTTQKEVETNIKFAQNEIDNESNQTFTTDAMYYHKTADILKTLTLGDLKNITVFDFFCSKN